MTEEIVRHINENSDSIEIGTPGKGGVMKVYGDFNKPEEFKAKIDQAAIIRLYAENMYYGSKV